jgi:hypothetical protein
LHFIYVSAVVAWIVALVAGKVNFDSNTWRYYEWTSLNFYPSVDPLSSGAAFTDAGSMVFTLGSRIDRSRSWNFKNADTYCIAPIVSPKAKLPPGSYDFWAVGMNCCGEHTPSNEIDFQCGKDVSDSGAGGLRIVDVQPVRFYRLAVEQAKSKYHVTSNHPIFLTWSKDPLAEVNKYSSRGVKTFLCSVLLFIGIHSMLTVTTLGVFVYGEK